MPPKPINDDVLQETVNVKARLGNDALSAAELGLLSESTVRRRLRLAQDKGITPKLDESSRVELPNFPDDDVDAEQILDMMQKRFSKRIEHHQSLHWFPIKFKTSEPIGIVVVGDPHLGSNGCNIPLLREHVSLMKSTPGCYAVNIGDTADNWGGNLLRLYAENDVSKSTERKLARWFLQESGVPWIVWLEGNHDHMDGGFVQYLKAINAKSIPMVDWRARFRLVFPNEVEARFDAAHNHKGHSMWNPLHGQTRAAHMDEVADVYVAGHHHTWALSTQEMADGRIIHLARARGYKFIDEHAHRHGFNEQQYGAAIMFVIRPKHNGNALKFIRSFADIEDGCEYLRIVQKKDGQ
jgi:hypothetical protein